MTWMMVIFIMIIDNDMIIVMMMITYMIIVLFFFIGQVLDLPNTGNHTQHITCTIRLEIALS